MKAPTEAEQEEMIQQSMDELRRLSGGDFDEYAIAFFEAGFKCAISAMLVREVLANMPKKPHGEN